MPERVDWISEEDWATIVDSVPIVSVDLVVEVDGGVLLTRRTNEPAKGEWFVPGGRVQKNESLASAVHRVANDELGVDVEIVEQLGVYEHRYDTSDVDGVDSKHYVPIGYRVEPNSETFELDAQHEAMRVLTSPPEDVHPYVEAYLDDAGIFE